MKIAFTILIAFMLFHLSNSQDDYQNIGITTDYRERFAAKAKVAKFFLDIMREVYSINVKIIPKDIDEQIVFYMSKEKHPNYFDSEIKMYQGEINGVTISRSDDNMYYYLVVNTLQDNSEFTLEVTVNGNIYTFEKTTIITTYYSFNSFQWNPREGEVKGNYFFYNLAENSQYLYTTLRVDQGQQEIEMTHLLKNGIGAVVDGSQARSISISLRSDGIQQIGVIPLPLETTLQYSASTIGYVEEIYTNCYIIPFKHDHDVIMTITSYPSPITIEVQSEIKTVLNTFNPLISDSLRIKLTLQSKYICIKYKQAESKYATYSFQVFKYNAIEDKQSFITPIQNGIQTKFLIPAGKAVSFRRRQFRNRSVNSELHLHNIKGVTSLYAYQCVLYPCSLTQASISELMKENQITKAIGVNDDQHLSIYSADEQNFDSYNKLLGVASCESTIDCEFYFTMFFDADEIQLVPQINYNNLVIQGSSNKYTFELDNKSIKSLQFTLHCYTGDAKIIVENVSNENYIEKTFLGNTKTITYSFTDGSTPLSNKYSVEVQSEESSFYSISVNVDLLVQSTIVNSGEIEMKTITFKAKEETFKLYNRANTAKKPYLISLQALNCNMKYSFYDKKDVEFTKEASIIVEPTSAQYMNEYYELKILINNRKIEITDDNYLCMFYVSGIETEYKELLISEGIDHQLEFIKGGLSKMSYLYPYPVSGGVNQVMIDLSFFDKTTPLKVSIDFKTQTKTTTVAATLKRSSQLVYNVENTSFEDKLLTNVIVNIETDTTSLTSPLPYKLNIKTLKVVPKYINKNESIKSIVNQKSLQYYYTDISQNEEGEVRFSFHKGHGQIYARIVQKGLKEVNGWNDHVILPNRKTPVLQLLPYDYINNKMVYTTENTKDCPNGCELYIGIQSDITISFDYESANLLDFSIIIATKDSIAELNINEYSSGSLATTQMYNYYTITIPFDADEIKITLISDSAKVYISKGNTKPNESAFDWSIFDSKGVMVIGKTDPKINSPSMKGLTFTFAIKATLIPSNTQSNYSIKVSASIEKLKSVTTLNGEKNEICDFPTGDNYCNLVRFVNQYEKVNSFSMAVQSINNIYNTYEIYVTIMDQDFFESQFTLEHLPSKKMNDFNSASSPTSNELHFTNKDTDKMINNYYIVIRIHATQKGLAYFLSSSISDNISEITLNQHTKTFFYMKPKQTITYSFKGGDNYLMNIAALSGTGTVSYGSNNKVNLSESVVIDVNANAGTFRINTDNTELYIIMDYVLDTNQGKGNVKEIGFGKNTISTNTVTNKVYFKTQTGIKDKGSLMLQLKYSTYTLSAAPQGSEDFDITAYMTTYAFIQEAIKDPTKKPTSKAITGVYNSILHEGMININQLATSNANANEAYVYLEIAPSANNKNSYTKLVPELVTYPTNLIDNIYVFPSFTYITNVIDSSSNINVLKLKKTDAKHQMMLIEYSSCVDDSLLDFAIRKYSEVNDFTSPDIKTNSTNIEFISKERKYGKIRMVLKLKDDSPIAFIAFAKQTSSTTVSLSYVIKYSTDVSIPTESPIQLSKSALDAKYSETDGKIESSWNSLIEEKTADASVPIKDVQFVYRVIKRGNNEPKSNSICMMVKNDNGLNEKVPYTEGVITMNKDFKFESNSYGEISVIALLTTQNEYLAYDLYKITIGKPVPDPEPTPDPDPEPKPSDPFPTYGIVLIVICAVIIVGVTSFFLARKCRRGKRNLVSDDIKQDLNMGIN